MGTPAPGSSTPKSDGNMLLDCVVCGRQVRFSLPLRVQLVMPSCFVLILLVALRLIDVCVRARLRQHGMRHISVGAWV